MKRVYLFLFLSSICPAGLLAQPDIWQWAKTAIMSPPPLNAPQDNRDATFNNVAIDNSGNIYVTGGFTSDTITFPPSTSLINQGPFNTEDVFLVRYDMNSNVLWALGVGGNGNDFGSAVATDKSGNIFLTGTFTSDSISFGSYTIYNKSKKDSSSVFLAKYDSSGNALWAISLAGIASNYYGLATDNNGNAYITGYFDSDSLRFSDTTLYNARQDFTSDIFIAKYDKNGNNIWAVGAGGNSFDYSINITVDNSANVYITGGFSSDSIIFGAYTLYNPFHSDTVSEVFTAKYDSNGHVLWAAGTTGNANAYGYAGAIDAGGNVYIVGAFQSDSVRFGPYVLYNTGPGNEASNIFVTKYDNEGNVQWLRGFVGGNYDYGTYIATDRENNVYITGSFNSTMLIAGNDTIYNTDFTGISDDIYVAKFDAGGNVIWMKDAGGYYYDYGLGLAIDTNEDIYACGSYNSTQAYFDSIILTSTSAFATYPYIAKLVCTPPASALITQSNDTLYSQATYGNQWCLNGNPITGATNPVYAALENGTYSDEVSNGPECTITSDSIVITSLPNNIKQLETQDGANIFPNPATKLLNITTAGFKPDNMSVYDVNGQTLLKQKFTTPLNIAMLSAGIYFMELKSANTVARVRFVKM